MNVQLEAHEFIHESNVKNIWKLVFPNYNIISIWISYYPSSKYLSLFKIKLTLKNPDNHQVFILFFIHWGKKLDSCQGDYLLWE